jgi:hypothetical protein
MATEADWNGVADDIREWVEAKYPKHTWSKWSRLVRKKSVEHYRAVIAKDAEYQKMIAPSILPPPSEPEPEAPEAPEAPGGPEAPPPPQQFLTSKRAPKPPKQPKRTTTDSHEAVKKKQTERLQAAIEVQSAGAGSAASKSARVAAVSRNNLHGKRAANEAGVLAMAQVTASESLQNGVSSINPARKRSRSATPTPLPPIQFAMLSSSMKDAGVPNFNPNPLQLDQRMDIHDLSNALRDSNSSTRMTFKPVEVENPMASLFSYSALTSDSLGDMASNSDRMEQLRRCCAR